MTYNFDLITNHLSKISLKKNILKSRSQVKHSPSFIQQMPQVSIAMATYNGEKYLRAQLESIVAQTEMPTEVIISDDGSTDNTVEIAETFQAPFDIRVLPQHERLGFADNFLYAAEHCRCPLVMFCDQDDIWLPQKLAISRRQLVQTRSLILLHALSMVDCNLNLIELLSQGIDKTMTYGPLTLDPYLCGYGNTMIFRRELLTLWPRDHRPSVGDGVISHDTWLYTLAAALGPVAHLADSYILYRRHGVNLSNLDDRNKLQRLADIGTFDVRTHVQRAEFNGRMADIFLAISGSYTHWAPRSAKAAQEYRLREALIRDRIALYCGERFMQRLASFRKVQQSRWKQAGSTKSKALPAGKDLF